MMQSMDDWRSVWEAVEAEAIRRGWSKEELARRTGVSTTTFDAMRRDGQPLKRAHKVARFLKGMGWLPGSIEAILAGGEPIPDPDATDDEPAGPEDRLDAIEDQLSRLNDAVARLVKANRRGVATVTAAQRELEKRLRRLEERNQTPGRGTPTP